MTTSESECAAPSTSEYVPSKTLLCITVAKLARALHQLGSTEPVSTIRLGRTLNRRPTTLQSKMSMAVNNDQRILSCYRKTTVLLFNLPYVEKCQTPPQRPISSHLPLAAFDPNPDAQIARVQAPGGYSEDSRLHSLLAYQQGASFCRRHRWQRVAAE
jgi:hypothetical protein